MAADAGSGFESGGGGAAAGSVSRGGATAGDSSPAGGEGGTLAGAAGASLGMGGEGALAGEGGGVAAPPQIVKLVAGAFFTCALRSNGGVKCWGLNNGGQLGLGDLSSRGDQPGEMGEALPEVNLGTQGAVVDIASGNNHSCALFDSGNVKCWGWNEQGQLGYGDTETRGDEPGEMGNALPALELGTGRKALAVTAGAAHTCVLLDDHSVKCWGDNSVGQLGLGDQQSRGTLPQQMGDALPAIDFGTPRTPVAIDAGELHTCALFDDGSLRCFGSNEFGQLGLGDTENRGDQPGEMGAALPAVDLGKDRRIGLLEVGRYHACAVLDDGGMRCFGHNNVGQLGLGDKQLRGDGPGEMGDALPTVDLGRSEAIVSLTSAWATCVVFDDRRMKCFGYNFDGQLGIGDIRHRGDGPGEMGAALPLVSVGSGRLVRSVALGIGHTCVLLDDESVKCWGYNGNGEFGLGNYDDRFGGDGDALTTTPLW